MNIVTNIANFITIFVHGFGFYCMWGWFIVPLGVPEINVWHSYGLVSMIGMPVGIITSILFEIVGEKETLFKISISATLTSLMFFSGAFIMSLLM